MDEQGAQVGIPAFRDAEQPWLAAGGMLSGYQSEPGTQIPCLGKAAGIAHGLREQTTRRAGWSRIGIGTLLAGSGAPVVTAVACLFVDFGAAESTIKPVAQALSAIVIGAAWPNLTGVLLTGLSDLIAKFTGGRK